MTPTTSLSAPNARPTPARAPSAPAPARPSKSSRRSSRPTSSFIPAPYLEARLDRRGPIVSLASGPGDPSPRPALRLARRPRGGLQRVLPHQDFSDKDFPADRGHPRPEPGQISKDHARLGE